MLASIAVVAWFASLASAQATAPQWGQCGGQNWSGPTTCPSGWTCVYSNTWYSQCLQGSPTTGTSTSTTTTTTSTSTSTLTTTTTTTTGTATVTGSPLGPTLVPPNLWIRAVAAPNYHKYLQAQNPGQPGPAVLGSHTTAAQFQLNNGQLELQLAGGQKLYLHVHAEEASTATYLSTEFKTTPGTDGTFGWQGDTLTWTAPGINRPFLGGFLACGDATTPKVYVNLGPYAYQTPAGCADQTIHYYNDATAVY